MLIFAIFPPKIWEKSGPPSPASFQVQLKHTSSLRKYHDNRSPRLLFLYFWWGLGRATALILIHLSRLLDCWRHATRVPLNDQSFKNLGRYFGPPARTVKKRPKNGFWPCQENGRKLAEKCKNWPKHGSKMAILPFWAHFSPIFPARPKSIFRPFFSRSGRGPEMGLYQAIRFANLQNKKTEILKRKPDYFL